MAFLTRPTIRWRHQKLQPQLDGGRPYRIPTTGSTRHFSVPPQTPDSLDSISDSWSLDDDVEEGDDWNDNDDDYRQNIIRQGENRADYKWFQNMTSLPFACTGCGKCCKTEGHVYMAPEEHDEASKLLGISKDEFIQHYASHVIVSEEEEGDDDEEDTPVLWLRLLDQSTIVHDDKEKAAQASQHKHGCIFLQDDNTCRIYEARPSQCSTYPFWPDILASQQAWNKEVRRPDDEDLDDDNQSHNSDAPLWTVESGGCEGMQRIPKTPESSSTHSDNENNSDDEDFDISFGIPREQVYIQSHVYEYDEKRIPRTKEIPVKQYFKQ